MAQNSHGGYRQPSKPAPVSGPGALSKRTDGGAGQPVRPITGLPYGQNQELNNVQGAAPMAATATPNGQQGSAAPSAPAPTPLFAPTQRPGEPLTEGNPMGAGSGESVLSKGPFQQDSARSTEDVRQRWLPSLLKTAEMENVPGDFVRLVRAVRDM